MSVTVLERDNPRLEDEEASLSASLRALLHLPRLRLPHPSRKIPELEKKARLSFPNRQDQSHSKSLELTVPVTKAQEPRHEPVITTVKVEAETEPQSSSKVPTPSQVTHEQNPLDHGPTLSSFRNSTTMVSGEPIELETSQNTETQPCLPEGSSLNGASSQGKLEILSNGKFQFLAKDCYYAPTMEVDRVLQEEFDKKIRRRLCGVLRRLKLNDARISLECAMTGTMESAASMRPTILFMCFTQEQKKKVLTALNKTDYIPEQFCCKVVIYEIKRCSTEQDDVDEMTMVGKVVEAQFQFPPPTLCGLLGRIPLSGHDKIHAVSTLGGLILVNGSLYALTTAHGFCVSMGEASQLQSTTITDNRRPLDPNSMKTSNQTHEFAQLGTLHSYKLTNVVDDLDDDCSEEDLSSSQYDSLANGNDWALIDVQLPFYVGNSITIQDEAVEIEGHIPSNSLFYGNVYVCSGSRGVLQGILSGGTASVIIGQSIFDVKSITLDHELDDGDSGSWVIRDGKLCGYIFCRVVGLPRAYMLPIDAVFRSIAEVVSVDGIHEVSVPSKARISEIAESGRISHSKASKATFAPEASGEPNDDSESFSCTSGAEIDVTISCGSLESPSKPSDPIDIGIPEISTEDFPKPASDTPADGYGKDSFMHSTKAWIGIPSSNYGGRRIQIPSRSSRYLPKVQPPRNPSNKYGAPMDIIELDVLKSSASLVFNGKTPQRNRPKGTSMEPRRDEAYGTLTGGLGAGLKPEIVLTSKELFAKSQYRETRSFHWMACLRSRSRTTPSLKELGQAEANRRGQIIKIIDLPISGQHTMISYPQPNWKPFPMRGPYLVATIMLCITLAVNQEYMYRRAVRSDSNHDFKLDRWEYLSYKFLPTICVIVVGILWRATDVEIKRLEPYYQLSREGGASFSHSIGLDYTTFGFLLSFKALRSGHFTVFVSSITTSLSIWLPILQAASVQITTDFVEEHGESVDRIKFDAISSRTLSLDLLIIAILGLVLFWQLQLRRSGLLTDIKGIAGIASMANRSHLLNDFKDLDTATPDMIYERLKARRYMLQNSSIAPEDSKLISEWDTDKYDRQRSYEYPHPYMLRVTTGVALITALIVFFSIIPVILFTRARVVAEKLPWLLTTLAVGVKMAWGALETDTRRIEPYYILSRRHAPPETLTLDYASTAFGWTPIRAFLNRHFVVGLVALGSVLAEILIVCVTSFGGGFLAMDTSNQSTRANNNTGEDRESQFIYRGLETETRAGTHVSFWMSFSLAVVALTSLCIIAALVYWRRHHVFMPRQPTTIASILAFIHQSVMMYDFVGTEKMSSKEMTVRMLVLGKSYGFGWFVGRDGATHCGIDEEQLKGDYKHGVDRKRASMPWSTNWEDF